jgi:hypothetical protein
MKNGPSQELDPNGLGKNVYDTEDGKAEKLLYKQYTVLIECDEKMIKSYRKKTSFCYFQSFFKPSQRYWSEGTDKEDFYVA